MPNIVETSDAAANTATAYTLAVGSSATGSVTTSGDHDWYRVNLVAGTTYQINLDGSGASALSDPYLYLRDSTGAQIASNDDGGPGANSQFLYFRPATSGAYYLDAAAYGTLTGQYTLSASVTTPAPTYTVDQVAAYIQDGMGSHFSIHTITYNVAGLTTAEQTLARLALQTWSDVANLTFVETSNAANISFDDNVLGSAYASRSGDSATINIGSDWYYSNTATDSYTFQTYIHEIGHALGLGHAGPYNGSATYNVDSVYTNDSWAYTVMSYFDQEDAGLGSYRFTMTPMIADIVAIQNTYGVNATVRAGNTVYGHNATAGSLYNFANYTTAPAFTIYDAGGTDTLDTSGYSNSQTLNLNVETFSSIGGLTNNIAIGRGALIENAIGGSGSDTIYGNDAGNVLTGNAGADYLYGGIGNDTLSGGDGQDFLYGGVGFDTVDYSYSSDDWYVNLANGVATNLSFGGQDILSSIENATLGNGSDIIQLYSGYFNSLINGNAGSDTVFVTYFYHTGYTIQAGSQATNVVMLGSDGSDTFQNVEYVHFADGTTVTMASLLGVPTTTFSEGPDTVTLTQPSGTWHALGGNDIVTGTSGADTIYGDAGNDWLLGDGTVMPTENAASINRLYLATLGRGPDGPGQAGWTSALDSGTSLDQIASGFINSAEFQARYGPVDNMQFVTLLYNNVLHRAPDASGLSGWVGALNSGALTRTGVVLGFSESLEFSQVSDSESHASQVYRLYGATLGRQPDADGFAGWVSGLDNGMGINDATAGFVNSAEFQARYGALDNTQFVTLLYNNVLHRAPDSGGLSGWVAALNSGALTRTGVVLGFSDSAEHIGNSAATMHTFMSTFQPNWNDMIEGGTGNDSLSGGHGNDTYVFHNTEIGSDDVYLFESWDTLQFAGYNYATSAQAISHMAQSGNYVVFSDQGQTITFHGATIADMQQANWLLA